jgi:hypothetical protein
MMYLVVSLPQFALIKTSFGSDHCNKADNAIANRANSHLDKLAMSRMTDWPLAFNTHTHLTSSPSTLNGQIKHSRD